MRILVTGSQGFIGSNLTLKLAELEDVEIVKLSKNDDIKTISDQIQEVDVVIHLAGVNRPSNDIEFIKTNIGLTERICELIYKAKKRIPIIFASTIQIDIDPSSKYSQSKLEAEELLRKLSSDTGTPCCIYRLPGVFGKWCKPNYNSVVATFCSNVARNLPIEINDKSKVLHLCYIDDVINEFLQYAFNPSEGMTMGHIPNSYTTTLVSLANQILSFKNSRSSLIIDKVGGGFLRKLYATYVSYLPPEEFSYTLPSYSDDRGTFVEILKTVDCGQFSFFTVKPGITRGSHYHHTKTEKFILVKGDVRMKFRNLINEDVYEISVSEKEQRVVESIPGWVHDITNIGVCDAIVFLWSNELFDKLDPDCIPMEV